MNWIAFNTVSTRQVIIPQGNGALRRSYREPPTNHDDHRTTQRADSIAQPHRRTTSTIRSECRHRHMGRGLHDGVACGRPRTLFGAGRERAALAWIWRARVNYRPRGYLQVRRFVPQSAHRRWTRECETPSWSNRRRRRTVLRRWCRQHRSVGDDPTRWRSRVG